jgi:hypothetical protein
VRRDSRARAPEESRHSGVTAAQTAGIDPPPPPRVYTAGSPVIAAPVAGALSGTVVQNGLTAGRPAVRLGTHVDHIDADGCRT